MCGILIPPSHRDRRMNNKLSLLGETETFPPYYPRSRNYYAITLYSSLDMVCMKYGYITIIVIKISNLAEKILLLQSFVNAS
jgi:hypothetical protein